MITAAIILGAAAVCGIAAAIYVTATRDLGRHVADPLTVPEVHHEEYTLPTRGDAQGRDVRVRATDSRPAPGADLTGSLSPRTQQEGARAASAPQPGPTPPASPAGTVNATAHQPPPGTRPGTPLPPAVEHALDHLRATVAQAGKPTDEQRWPHLQPAWQDSTDTFAAIAAGWGL